MSEAGPSEPASASVGKVDLNEDAVLKEFLKEVRDVDRDNEVNRILWAFKLNPFEKLNMRFTAGPEDIKRQYRKVSLLVHPDKCKHPQAAQAFEILGQAQKDLLDEEKYTLLMKGLDLAREEVRKERRKETKHDTVVKLASLIHEEGRQGVEAEWEKSDEFHEKWKLKAREMLAQAEWRKRKLSKRMKDEEARIEKEEKETRDKIKKQKNHDKEWESSRETRVGTWRDFMNSSKSKKAAGGLKPPKSKTNDEDKLYVQRPVGEQFRPPPPKSKS